MKKNSTPAAGPGQHIVSVDQLSVYLDSIEQIARRWGIPKHRLFSAVVDLETLFEQHIQASGAAG